MPQRKRRKLKKLIKKMISHEKESNDYMDSGQVICLKKIVEKDRKDRRAKRRYGKFLVRSNN